jgi:hypothetical protein
MLFFAMSSLQKDAVRGTNVVVSALIIPIRIVRCASGWYVGQRVTFRACMCSCVLLDVFVAEDALLYVLGVAGTAMGARAACAAAR